MLMEADDLASRVAEPAITPGCGILACIPVGATSSDEYIPVPLEHTQVDADPTGTAGVAGLLAARRDGLIGPDETVVVLLTGAERRH
jgi:hypothetical protein